jgi:hypothetical protein
MLVFAANEAFFYCPRGVLSEGICFGDNANESLRTESWSRDSSIGLCGTIHQAISTLNGPSTLNIAKRRILYNDLFLGLLRPYMRRTLRYDDDILNAFSGIIHALGYFLGAFHWGMPTAVLGRALLMSPGKAGKTWARRVNFPSWSWLGWKHTGEAAYDVQDIFRDDERTLSILIHIHIFSPDDTGACTLLLGPRSDAQGIEGYCSRNIAQYNQLSNLETLPHHPSLERAHLPHNSNVDPSHVLVFHTHVACFRRSDAALNTACWQFEDPRSASWRERYDIEPIKVVLVAVSTVALPREEDRWGSAFDTHAETFGPRDHQELYHGIIVRQYQGISRRVGIVDHMTRSRWLAGEPRKELVFLA